MPKAAGSIAEERRKSDFRLERGRGETQGLKDLGKKDETDG